MTHILHFLANAKTYLSVVQGYDMNMHASDIPC